MLGGLLLPYFLCATWIKLYALKIKIYMFMGYAELGVSFAYYPNNFMLRQPNPIFPASMRESRSL